MSNPSSQPISGRLMCRAVAEATGIQRIRQADVISSFDGVTEFRVTFLASAEQARKFGAAIFQIMQEEHPREIV